MLNIAKNYNVDKMGFIVGILGSKSFTKMVPIFKGLGVFS